MTVSYRYNYDLYQSFKFRVVLMYGYVTKSNKINIVVNYIKYGIYYLFLATLLSQDVYEGYTLFTPGGGGGGGASVGAPEGSSSGSPSTP